jgi:hypothetical protein
VCFHIEAILSHPTGGSGDCQRGGARLVRARPGISVSFLGVEAPGKARGASIAGLC